MSGPQRSGPDGAYFVDLEVFGPGHSTGSGIAVFNNIPDGGNRDGAQPDKFQVLGTAAGNAGLTTWDNGLTETIVLDGGETFTWTIGAGASTAANFTAVGTASNSAGRQMTIYKDDGHELFIVANNTDGYPVRGWRASTRFWCF